MTDGQTMDRHEAYATAQRWSRVSGSCMVMGSAILAGSGRVTALTGQCVSQTRCLTRFCVSTCAFIVALFLQSNSISANWWIHVSRPSCILSNGHDLS